MRLTRSERWYQRRLNLYFMRYCLKDEDEAEFYNDPAINQWLFDVPSRNERVELTCNNDGLVSRCVYHLCKE